MVVPVHDEQRLLGACLASIAAAARHPALRGAAVQTVVVLDACTDGSEQVTRAAARIDALRLRVLQLDARNVGLARATGCTALLDHVGWLATTDADSVVPADWLAVQLALAAAGADAVTGTVRVDGWDDQPTAVRTAFELTYGTPPDGHPHAHGANLGVRAAAYRAVGGFRSLPLAEDQSLVDALLAGGHRVHATGAIPVRTSARRTSRTSGGFADHLRDLGAALA